MGFRVVERPFEYSALPGRFATPLFGGAAALVILAALHLGFHGAPLQSLAMLVVGGVILLAAGRWTARHAVLRFPLMRRRGVNLEATRAGRAPRIWLCAHLDSKSQPVPTLVRTVGIVAVGACYAYALWLAAMAVVGARPADVFWYLGVVVTLVGAVPVMTSMVGNASVGALDNASGVATVLAAAAELSADEDVGVLITDAEELGLAGAHAWGALADRNAIVLNCDGVDDDGADLLMYGGGNRPHHLIQAAREAASETDARLVPRRLPVGVLTDSVAFAMAGIASATFSRGSVRSLRRVHSRRDDLDHLRGTGIAPMASLMASTARVLLNRQ